MNTGMDRSTGKPLTGIEHLRQSILDILSTRIGTRVMRRDYGSHVADIIDVPVNDAFAVRIYAAIAEALDKWEPRFKLNKIDCKWNENGQVSLSFEGLYLPSGKPITMEGLLIK
ncbi:GPW/gp25 family protein [Bartonella machadoae]|uniref:GPW/gp25 family protein n=1 Tax=Bartonella machadoae TaxID=2893471 RepID=UPI001F4C86BD|nr:GPW/gp25 family protein [Bartonella machadoae]UNE54399.1 GPW/gp25 family protein [Bartonella machadoae]UNE54471.1 GPW/gp25 family protein [Bartonella machadoae]UNE55257.1 GPW/gp25 family protein [Bartonella machadoae]